MNEEKKKTNERLAKVDGLTPAQFRAAAMLAEGSTYAAAGEAAGHGYRVIRDWLEIPAFRKEFEKRTRDGADLVQTLANRARLRLLKLTDLAADVVEDGMRAVKRDGETPDHPIRLKAAEMTLRAVGFADTKDKAGGPTAQAAVIVIGREDVEMARAILRGDPVVIRSDEDVIDVEEVLEDEHRNREGDDYRGATGDPGGDADRSPDPGTRTRVDPGVEKEIPF